MYAYLVMLFVIPELSLEHSNEDSTDVVVDSHCSWRGDHDMYDLYLKRF